MVVLAYHNITLALAQVHSLSRRARCAADNVDRIAAGLEPLYRVD
jgi:hypothetical protein